MAATSLEQKYIDKWAALAMDAQRRYGIPASITLAQGIVESASGTSGLFKKSNNMFGIHGTYKGEYVVAKDVVSGVKFRKYPSELDSFHDHTRLLATSPSYAKSRQCAQDDHRGWAMSLDGVYGGLKPGDYSSGLISTIKRCDLAKYDAQAKSQGRLPKNDPWKQTSIAVPNAAPTTISAPVKLTSQGKNYHLPIPGKEFIVTSPYGNRRDPTRPSQGQFHTGIDLRAKHGTDLYATEDGGKVVKVNNSVAGAGGKSVHVEYSRPDGSKWDVLYCHMSSISVKVGDKVNAGDKVGLSGNTGTHTTGAHLHLATKFINSAGSVERLDPSIYLAEICQRGNLDLKMLSKSGQTFGPFAQNRNKDLMALYGGKGQMLSPTKAEDGTDLAAGMAPEMNSSTSSETPVDQTLTPETWMKKLLAGSNIDTGDALVDILMSFLFGTTAIAQTIEGKETEDARKNLMEAITDTVVAEKLDLTAAVPGAEKCVMDFSGKGNPIITLTADGKEQTRQLTDKEVRKMSVIAQDSRLTKTEKAERMAVAASIVAPSSAPSVATKSDWMPEVKDTVASNFDIAMSQPAQEKTPLSLNLS